MKTPKTDNQQIIILSLLLLLLIFSCSDTNSIFGSHSSGLITLESDNILENTEKLDSFIAYQAEACGITTQLKDVAFGKGDTLRPYISFIFIKPYKNYVYEFSAKNIIDTLQSHYKEANIKPILLHERQVVDSNILNYYANYEAFVKLYSRRESFYILIFPEGVKFRQELSGNRRVSKISGSSLQIPSEACFIREEVAQTSILTHEVAHCFGLRHIFQKDGNDEYFGFSCTTGDLISDTPYTDISDKFMYTEDGTCKMYTIDTLYPEKFKQIVMHNFTSYSHVKCMRQFTNNQIKTMQLNLLTYAQLSNKLSNEEARIDYSRLLYSD